jgi:SAM-dependent methyltransferase
LKSIRRVVKKAFSAAPNSGLEPAPKPLTPQEYWTSHNVTLHFEFRDAAESLEYFHWRCDQYVGYIDLLPVSGHDSKVIVDYGCGPGHDLIGIGVYSKPARLIGVDVSQTSLREARARLRLHGIDAELHQIGEHSPRLPLPDGSVDYIHCSGVLHHVSEPANVLREFARLLKPDGEVRLMVYNYESLWFHYYTAYEKRIVEGLYRDLDLRAAFAKTTDGEACPISRVYKPEEMTSLAREADFRCRFLGAAISVFELSLCPRRFGAIMDRRLPRESRDFLLHLELDSRGFPIHRGTYAGVDGCYSLALDD